MREKANKNYKKALIFPVLLLLFGFLLGISCQPNMEKKAPDFSIKKLDGSALKLSDFQGKAILLNFWATYCPPCIKEMPMFQTYFEKYRDKGFIIIGVSLDESAGVAEKFIKKMGVTYPIGMGTRKIIQQYKVSGLPSTFILNRSGNIIEHYLGPPTEERLEKDIHRALGNKQ